MNNKERDEALYLINDFMGHPINYIDRLLYNWKLQYTSDFRLIMQVIEKINSTDCPVTIHRGCVDVCDWRNGYSNGEIVRINKTDYIDLKEMIVYAIVDFIKWYNENK